MEPREVRKKGEAEQDKEWGIIPEGGRDVVDDGMVHDQRSAHVGLA